ncbi:hypothetical protein [Pedobacter nutrimenti]|uniref:hypothetical protein n=1 Tax=Pedobacter nutrimenti TaxID=1241337 RepID=UPI00292D739E|nr:hypothetical protein [Pedobacter nutrimenti]
MIDKKAIWISYDFGLKGDYTGLYTWLDNNNAKECGIGLAYCSFDVSQLGIDKKDKSLIEKITSDIKKSVKLSRTDRVYIIWKDSLNNKIRGEFINGARKQSPWEGYGRLNTENSVVDGE